MHETIQKHSTNNTKDGTYKYTYYQDTHTIVTTPPHTLTHTLQNKLKQTNTVQDTPKRNEMNFVPQ